MRNIILAALLAGFGLGIASAQVNHSRGQVSTPGILHVVRASDTSIPPRPETRFWISTGGFTDLTIITSNEDLEKFLDAKVETEIVVTIKSR